MAKKFILCVFLLWAGFVNAAFADESQMAGLLIKAEASGRPIPLLSALHPDMDAKLAYKVQQVYVDTRLKTEALAGFKAGLTSTGAQKKFKVDQPLVGALFKSGQLMPGRAVLRSDFHRPMIETEIGFILDDVLTAKVSDIPALKQHIKAVMPVIELPDLGFADMKSLKGVDIIAANVSSKYFIPGVALSPDMVELNHVTVTLSLDGQIVNQGAGKDAMGDQWEAALWMVNTLISQGRTLEQGQILITGALGKMMPGKPGQYKADFGSLGTVEFQLR